MLPVMVAQMTLGRTGDFLMSVLTVLVVIQTISAQIHSLSAIFMYDLYRTYISPFRLPSMTSSTSLALYKDEEISQYLSYNRRSVFLRHATTVFFCVLTFPAALIFMTIELPLHYKVSFICIVVGSSIGPVELSVIWHRTRGLGIVSGIFTGHAAGFAVALVYAMTFRGGLDDFLRNTSRQEVEIAAVGASVVVGAVVCILVSLCCGGLDRGMVEEDEWEKCRKLDNPVKPWALQYAIDTPNSKSEPYTSTPSYFQV